MRTRLTVLSLHLLLFVAACTFTLDEPTGITKTVTPVTSMGSITLTDYLNKDTIYLFNSQTFTFDISSNVADYEFEGNAYFDNNLFYTFHDPNGQFRIPDNYFKSGAHKLKISFNESLSDGSLISHLKDLTTTIFREWVVIINVDPPSEFEITTSVENGFVKYTWPAVSKDGFISYELIVNPGVHSKRVTITDASKNSYVDSTYIDGADAGSINVTTSTIHGNVESIKVVNEPDIELSIDFHSDDTTAYFAWSMPKYYGALKSYTILDGTTALATITNAADTTLALKIDGAFPNVTYLHFKMIDRFGTEIFTADKEIDFFIGNDMPQPTYGIQWYYSKQANKFISRAGATINIYDGAFNFLATRTNVGLFADVTVAWPGNFLHYVNVDNKISQLDLVSNNEVFLAIPGDYGNLYVNGVSGASSQVVTYNAFENDHVHPTKETAGFADMQNSTVLSQVENATWTTLSDDGRYSFAQGTLYSVSGSAQTLIGTTTSGYIFTGFRGDNTDEFIMTDYDASARYDIKTIIVRSSDAQIIRTIDPPEVGFSLTCYDPSTKTLLYTKFGATKVYLVDVDTGNKKIFKASGSSASYLLNGYIIIGSRYIKAL